MDDACRLDLPQRRLAGIVPTGLASRINAALKNRIIALGAFRPGRCQPGFVGGFEAQRVDEAVAIVVAELQDLPVADIAVGLGQPRIAFGMQALGALIVYDFVGLDRRSIVINLHISDRGNQLVIIIISDLVGLHQHLGIRGGLGCDARSGGFRPQWLWKVRFCASAAPPYARPRPTSDTTDVVAAALNRRTLRR